MYHFQANSRSVLSVAIATFDDRSQLPIITLAAEDSISTVIKTGVKFCLH